MKIAKVLVIALLMFSASLSVSAERVAAPASVVWQVRVPPPPPHPGKPPVVVRHRTVTVRRPPPHPRRKPLHIKLPHIKLPPHPPGPPHP